MVVECASAGSTAVVPFLIIKFILQNCVVGHLDEVDPAFVLLLPFPEEGFVREHCGAALEVSPENRADFQREIGLAMLHVVGDVPLDLLVDHSA